MANFITTLEPFAIAILGGVVPTLLWLWFWYRQDRECPEPRGLITLSFIAGMTVVFFVLPVQKLIVALFPPIIDIADTLIRELSLPAIDPETLRNLLLATVEEVGKYATVFFIATRSKYFDEPVDAVVYLVTAALGFVAVENTLYILKDLDQSGVAQTIINGNLRFLGATLLHTVSSAVIGIAIAGSFYAPRIMKIIAVIAGVGIATLLHTHFNLTIMETNGTLNVLAVFSRYWIAIVGIVIIVAILKYFFNRQKTCTIV